MTTTTLAGRAGIGADISVTGYLMMEHRLIERMIRILNRAASLAENTGNLPIGLVDTAVDFFKKYGNERHHGKEERILFSELALAGLSPADKTMLGELTREHAERTELVNRLAGFNARYKSEGRTALPGLIANLKETARLYRLHIEKEERFFFPHIREYLTQGELSRMLECFSEFDGSLGTEDYAKTIEYFEHKILPVNSRPSGIKGGNHDKIDAGKNQKNRVQEQDRKQIRMRRMRSGGDY